MLGIIACAGTAHGAGWILFGNYYSSTQTTGIFYAGGPDAGLGVGPETLVTLLWGPSTATSVTQLAPVPGSTVACGLGLATAPGPVGGGSGAGWFWGGQVQVNNGMPGTYAFAIEAVSTLNGLIWTDYSYIAIGATQQTDIAPIPFLPDPLLKGNFLIGIPEPSTLAFAGSSLASLLLFVGRARHSVRAANHERRAKDCPPCHRAAVQAGSSLRARRGAYWDAP